MVELCEDCNKEITGLICVYGGKRLCKECYDIAYNKNQNKEYKYNKKRIKEIDNEILELIKEKQECIKEIEYYESIYE